MIPQLTYNNKILSAQEREEFYKMADETIAVFAESIDGMYEMMEEVPSSGNSDINKLLRALTEISIFIDISFADSIVLTKLFIKAVNFYEKSFLRGKLKVQLNESFKKLYGFTDKAHMNSYWAKLAEHRQMFPRMDADLIRYLRS